MKKLLVINCCILFISISYLRAQNYALDFDGTNDYVTASVSANNLSAFTFEGWVNPTTTSGTINLMGKSGLLELIITNGTVKFYHSSGTNQATASNTISANVWSHVAFTGDGTNFKIYINGVLKLTTAYSTANYGNLTSFNIGYLIWAGATALSGKMDEVRVWNVARTQTEVQNNMYNILSGSESGLVAYYKFNENSGSTLNDATSNNYDGTLTNMDASTDWVTSFEQGAYISGTSGFRMMSSPVSGTIYSDLLSELWTQGMTGGDVTTGSANVWTYSGSAWSALSNLSTASLTAGQGFLVYVYANTNNSGADDLPVTLSVSGTVNSSSATVPSSGSIADQAWELAGNPYASTIDWDLITKSNVTATAYVWDNASSGYKSWNGSSGTLTNGLIAPYQGFWVQGSGGTGSITIETGDQSGTGTFYKTTSDNTGSIDFTVTSSSFSDRTFVSFMTSGETGQDNADAWKLLPLTATERIVGLSYIDNQGLDINNLPYHNETEITIPIDIMKLTVDSNNNFNTTIEQATLAWDLSSLPESVTQVRLTNNNTNETTDLQQTDNITFTTAAKGSFPAYRSNGVNVYPQIGNSQFTLTITYRTLNTEEQPLYPKEYALHSPYPNPFNPDVRITFDVPLVETLDLTSLQIYNINGHRVETLANNPQPGTHTITWNPKNLSSGIYIIQLKTSEKVLNQKITYMK